MKPAVCAVLAALAVAACDQDMVDQPRQESYETSALFPGGIEQRPVEGTVARGELARLSALHERPPLTEALLQRGRERFAIYCTPCHGQLGDGRGMIVQRGFPRPPNYHGERLRRAPPRRFVQVITDGHGDMFSYAARVAPADRWAIAAYVKALQLSQHAAADSLPEDLRAALDGEAKR